MVSRSDDIRLRELLIERLGDETTKRLLERLPVMPVTNLATKDDLAALRGEVREVRGELLDEMGGLRGELRGEMGNLRGEMGNLRGEMGELSGEIGNLRGEMGELSGEMGNLRAEMERSTKSTIKWVAGLVFPSLVGGLGASAAIAAAIAS